MGMNPKTEEFQSLTAEQADENRAKGWPVFKIGEEIEVRGWRFEVVLCEGKALVLRGTGKTDAVSARREAVDEVHRQLAAHSADIARRQAEVPHDESGTRRGAEDGIREIRAWQETNPTKIPD